MTDDEKTEIYKGWKAITDRKLDLGGSFFRRLFDVHPEYASMFTDVNAQRAKFVSALGWVVGGIMMPHVQLGAEQDVFFKLVELGKRHAGYGVQPRQIAEAGEIFVQALEGLLREDFTESAKAAWRKFYRYVWVSMSVGLRSVGG